MSDAEKPNLPLKPEEIADRLVPANPQISPDGKNVVFQVEASARKGEHAESTLWLSRDGAEAQPFSTGSAHDRSAVWSPDGTKLAFLSDRAERGKGKLYVISLAGGEGRALGELSGELAQPKWSPDGKTIALLRTDPETDEEKKRKEEKNDPIVVDANPKRARLWLVNVETGKARQLTFGERHVWSFEWSRDGERLAIVTTKEPTFDEACSTGDLLTLPASGGVPVQVAHFPVLPNSPVFLEADGREVIAVICNGHRADPVDSVWIAPFDGGEPKNALPGHEGNVEGLAPVPGDPKRVAIRLVEHTHAHAYLCDPFTGKLEDITPPEMRKAGSITAGPSVSADGSKLAVVWSGGSVPHEVYVAKAGKAATKLTDFGKSFAGRLSPTEIVTWQSDGWEIEGILTYPAGYEEGTRYPLIVEAHGGPSWQWEDYCFLDWHDWAQLMASNGFAVLAVNPRGSTGRGAEFQQQLQDDVGGGEVRDLVNGALAMVERGIADRDRLGIGGWSWGGYLTATTVAKSDIFKAAMMGAGLANLISDHGTDDIPTANLLYFPGHPYDNLDLYWEGSAIKHITNCTTPTLILHGDADARVAPTQGAEMYRALKVLGVPVEFVRYPRQGHGIEERNYQIDLMTRLVDWFTKWLKPAGRSAATHSA
jgi:dipeptidyl aminopeptidase/acylaminoacyl peptidase